MTGKYTTLENEFLELAVDLDRGASIMAFFAKQAGGKDNAQGDALLPIMPDTRRDDDGVAYPRAAAASTDNRNIPPLECSSFFMVPYSNRIRGGRFTFEGKEYYLGREDTHAIHGCVRDRPFTVRSVDAQVLRAVFESSDHDVDWPWPFRLEIGYTIEKRRLTIDMCLNNLADSAMPAGFGIHPYFSKVLGDAGRDDALLSFGAAGVFTEDDDHMPTGPPLHHPMLGAYRRLDHPPRGNHYFAGYEGGGRIVWPGSGLGLSVVCDPVFRQLVVFAPDAPYFAFEPVTNAADGFNLRSRGIEGHGVSILQPRESLAGAVSFTLIEE